jgi:UDP-glucose 4-epimerase
LLPFLNFLRLNATRRLPVVFASSGGTIYGQPQYLPIDEAHPTDPISPYGIVKLSMEKYLGYFGDRYGFRYTILRISNPYGGRHHRRNDQGVIDVFAKKIAHGEELVIWGNGSIVRDYVHILDVCRSFLCAILYTGTSTVFNIGAGEGRSILDIIDALSVHLAQPPKLRFEEGRSYDIAKNVLDISHARSELGWQPVSDFGAGLAETLRNVK